MGTRKVITKEDWEKKLSYVKIRKEDMNRLVMNFLFTEGYVEAAERFRLESWTEPDIDLATITVLLAINKAVQSGCVEDAIKKVNDLNPEILDTNPQLFFHLQQQRLIELIRNGYLFEALEFAEKELAPIGKENQSFLEELERTVSLLAFEDVTRCPVGELLDVSRRMKIACEVNAAILTCQSHEKGELLQHCYSSLRKYISETVCLGAIHFYLVTCLKESKAYKLIEDAAMGTQPALWKAAYPPISDLSTAALEDSTT